MKSDCCGTEIGLDALTLSIIYLGRKKESLKDSSWYCKQCFKPCTPIEKKSGVG